MRLKNSGYNVIFNILQLFITTVLSFVARTFFIRYLGKELLGIDGLFTNILSMLSLTELGIGTAISFSLYKPLAIKNTEEISSLMTMYKKIYTFVGLMVLVIGLLITPLLPFFTKGYDSNNLYLIYFLYLLSTASSYFIIYKETLIIADQNEHKLFGIRTIFVTILYLIQILILVYTKNFIYYLIAALVIKFIQNIVTNIFVSTQYSDVNFNSKTPVSNDTKQSIKQNVKNLFVSKIGDYLLNGTDNIIISAINIALTGIYSNYLSIIGIMKTVMNAIYNGVVSSFGNMVATENKEVQENVFDISNFVCFLISGFITVELVSLFNPFIQIWAGSDYVVDLWMAIVISFNFYFYSQLLSLDSMKIAAGMYHIDKYVSITQAIVNLIFSIILGHFMGLGGVILGTLLSYLFVGTPLKPYLIYKHIFNKSVIKYYLSQLKYFIVLLINIIINYFFFANFSGGLLLIFCKAITIMFIYIFIIVLVYRKSKEYRYISSSFGRVVKARSIKNENVK